MTLKNSFSKKIFTFFTRDTQITQNEYHSYEDDSSEEEARQSIIEKWNNLFFKTSLSKLDSIIKKSKSKKWKWILLRASLYYDIDINQSKEIIEYLEKNSLNDIKNDKEYWKLKYKLYLKDDDLEKLVYDFSENRENLKLLRHLRLNENKESLDLLEKLNKQDEINYLIVKLNLKMEEKTKVTNEVISLTTQILEKLSLETLITQLTILADLNNFFNIYIPLLSKESIYELEEQFLRIYEKNFKISEYLSDKWEKKIINTFVSIKIKNEYSRISKVEILENNRQYLNKNNNIIYLILVNKGYKSCLVNLSSNKDFVKIENIYNMLFLNQKYKYLIHLHKKYISIDDDSPINLRKIEIYSKIMGYKKISKKEIEILAEDTLDKLSELYLTISNFRNKLISKDTLHEKIFNLLNIDLNLGYFQICILRVMYLEDKNWIIDYLKRAKEQYPYLVEELIRLATFDYNLDGITYERICSLEPGLKNIDYEAIGTGYIEYKNLKKGLVFLLKSWSENKNLILANKILFILLRLEQFNQEIYEYLKKNIPPKDYVFRLQNIVMYSFDNSINAEIEMNKILLLKISKKFIKENSMFFNSLYIKFVLEGREKKLTFKNSIYINLDLIKIADIYRNDDNKEKIQYFSKEEFDILKISNLEKLQNLNTYLIMSIVKNNKVLEQKHSGIIALKMKDSQDKNFLKIIQEITGINKFEKKEKEYFDKNNKENILNICHRFEEYESLIKKVIDNFDKELMNKISSKMNINKILSLDSIIFLKELNLFKYLNLKNISVLKSVYNQIKSKAGGDKDYEVILLKLYNESNIIDDSALNDFKRNREPKNTEISIVMKIVHAFSETNGDFVTEDRNCVFKNNFNVYSSIYLILFQIKNKELNINLLNEKAKQILGIAYYGIIEDQKE